MMQKVCPEFTPFYQIIEKTEDLDLAIQSFKKKEMRIVVKPQGLTPFASGSSALTKA
jgi:hypothetical protein